MSFGRKSRPADYWLRKLNGHIIFIKGNHEKISRRFNVYDKLILNYQGKRFLLIHDPYEAPKDFDGWIIHGHTHNNEQEYPLINKQKKTINVSVEVTNYKPLLIDDLLKMIEEK